MKVWVLIITSKPTDDVYVCRDEAAAHRTLATWAREWWGREVGETEPMPKDDQSLVAKYFEAVAERESFNLDEYDVI